MMKHRILGVIVGLGALLVLGSASGEEIPLPLGGSYRHVRPPLEASSLKLLVDRAVDAGAGATMRVGETGALPPAEALAATNPGDIALLLSGAPEVIVNPEPSSALVWTALGMGLAAAGYGYRWRRLDNPVQLSA